MNAPHPSRPVARSNLIALPSPALLDADAVTLLNMVQHDPRAAAVLWERFSRPVRGVLQRLLGPEASVEALVEEVFDRLLRRASHLRGVRALDQVILRIALDVGIRELRRQRWTEWFARAPVASVAEHDETRHGELPERRLLRRLYAALDELSVRERVVFALRYFERMRVVEVAETLGLSVQKTERSLARATRAVLSELEGTRVPSAFASDLEVLAAES